MRVGTTAEELDNVIQLALGMQGDEQYPKEAGGHGTGHGTVTGPEEEASWIRPGKKTVLGKNMVFTLKPTITVHCVGGLRTERIVRFSPEGVGVLDNFSMELD